MFDATKPVNFTEKLRMRSAIVLLSMLLIGCGHGAVGIVGPAGGSVTYLWTSNCYYVANGTAYTYRVDVQPDDTCLVDLRVTDAQGRSPLAASESPAVA